MPMAEAAGPPDVAVMSPTLVTLTLPALP